MPALLFCANNFYEEGGPPNFPGKGMSPHFPGGWGFPPIPTPPPLSPHLSEKIGNLTLDSCHFPNNIVRILIQKKTLLTLF